MSIALKVDNVSNKGLRGTWNFIRPKNVKIEKIIYAIKIKVRKHVKVE